MAEDPRIDELVGHIDQLTANGTSDIDPDRLRDLLSAANRLADKCGLSLSLSEDALGPPPESVMYGSPLEPGINDQEKVLRYRAIIENINEGIIQIDTKGVIQFVNRRLCEMTGYSEDDLLGRKSPEMFLSRDQIPYAQEKARLRKDGVADRYPLQIRRKDGGTLWVEVSGTPLYDYQNEIVGSAGIMMDISARKRAEDALRQSEERSALAARGGGEGLWDWNLITGEVYYSRAWIGMVGCEENEIGPSPDEWFIRIHPEDVDRVRTETDALLEGKMDNFEIEHRVLHRKGTYRWAVCRGTVVRNQEHKPYRLVGSLVDITEQRVNDPLTGLPNRTLFADRLQQAFQRAAHGTEDGFAVLFLNMERFRLINETLGHPTGDRLIITIAKRIEKCVDEDDTVARHGADQFTVLIRDVKDISKPSRIAVRITEELSQPFQLSGFEVFLEARIGITLSASGYGKPEQILRDAEVAMQRARAQKLPHALFDQSMHSRAMSILEFENDLRRAIKQEDLQLYYQPIMDIQSGRLSGVEALLRWNHEKRGMISPADFIPVAEETGLIVTLGEWVLRTAAAQNVIWSNQGHHFFVSVNLSARQFQHPGLIDMVRRALEDTKLEPSRLKMELTESVFVGQEDEAILRLKELKALGVQLAIDDFGTGYSSLSYLKRFPIDSLKIDKAFIKDIPDNSADGAITYAIIKMAHSLKLQVIAEGVQNEEQLKYLRMVDCDHMQGFYYSRPIPADEAERLIEERKPLFSVGY